MTNIATTKPQRSRITPEAGGYASVADSDTWASFDTASRYYRDTDAIHGIGFVFTEDDPYIGVDLDDCRAPKTGALDEWARDIIIRLDSYTETSPSGTGVHVIISGELPAGKHHNTDIELYDRDRYFTVTGDHLSLIPTTVTTRTAAMAAIHAEYMADPDRDDSPERPDSPPADELSDDDLIEYAMSAENGDKFKQLWSGDTSGYPSHSEADQALCNLLAFWTGGDPHRMERLFSKSGLIRDKWRDREDYRERTIKKAIRDCSAYYDH